MTIQDNKFPELRNQFDAPVSPMPFSLPPGIEQDSASLNSGVSEATDIHSTANAVASERPLRRRGKSSPMDPTGLDLNHVYSFTDLTCVEVICTGKRCGLSFIKGNNPQGCAHCGGPVRVKRSLWRSRRWLRTQRELFLETNGREGMRVQAANPNSVKGEWFWDAIKRSMLSKTKTQQYRRKSSCSTLTRSARVQG